MTAYDADRGPSAEFWALDEPERVQAIEAAHAELRPEHPPVESVRLHAAVHLVVETQLASDTEPETREALGRLLGQGSGRHAAVHAIGRIVSEHMFAVLEGHRFKREAFEAALRAL